MTPRKKETAQVEGKRTCDYELVFIVKPEATDESLEAAVNIVSQFIAGKNGVVADVERWGKKKLAYPVNHFLEGNYILTRFKMDPAWSRELEKNLRISEDIIRHMLIKLGS